MDTVNILKASLNDKLKIKDLGKLKYFLGLEVARLDEGIHICQRKYALDILKDSGTIGSTSARIPLDQNLKLSKEQGELLADPTLYMRLIGRLLYLTITRPDLAYLSNCQVNLWTVLEFVIYMLTHSVEVHQEGIGQGLFYSTSLNCNFRGIVT